MKKLTLIFSILFFAATSIVAQQQDDVFRVVEQMPEFEGGQEGLYKHLAQNLKYPEEAIENGVQGTVYVQFIVRPEGNVTDVNVVRGVNELLDAEAVRVVQEMPEWKPGMQKGKKVPVYFTLPVKFKLEAPKEVPEEIQEK